MPTLVRGDGQSYHVNPAGVQPSCIVKWCSSNMCGSPLCGSDTVDGRSVADARRHSLSELERLSSLALHMHCHECLSDAVLGAYNVVATSRMYTRLVAQGRSALESGTCHGSEWAQPLAAGMREEEACTRSQ